MTDIGIISVNQDRAVYKIKDHEIVGGYVVMEWGSSLKVMLQYSCESIILLIIFSIIHLY